MILKLLAWILLPVILVLSLCNADVTYGDKKNPAEFCAPNKHCGPGFKCCAMKFCCPNHRWCCWAKFDPPNCCRLPWDPQPGFKGKQYS